jgi:hypothetical protein
MPIKSQIPQIPTDDEHLAVRLGMAVAYQWDQLPKEAQDLLLEQATFVELPPLMTGQQEALRAFIREHKLAE